MWAVIVTEIANKDYKRVSHTHIGRAQAGFNFIINKWAFPEAFRY